MNSCKAMQAQAKSINSTQSSFCGVLVGRVKFVVTKKFSANGTKFNTFVVSVMVRAIKTNENPKAKVVKSVCPARD